jgi:hypothetical protein
MIVQLASQISTDGTPTALVNVGFWTKSGQSMAVGLNGSVAREPEPKSDDLF